jgi:hypothetical protein
MEFTWINAYAGHTGNELADKLTKEAANNREICCNKIPKSEIVRLEHQDVGTPHKNTSGPFQGPSLIRETTPRTVSDSSLQRSSQNRLRQQLTQVITEQSPTAAYTGHHSRHFPS